MAEINNANYQRKAKEIVEIHTLFKEGLATKGLGAIITERSWNIGYNRFNGCYRLPIFTYKTINELEKFKNVPIDVIGIDDSDSKGKDLIQLINKYGENHVISAEILYDPFWFQSPISPSWRFMQVLVKPWEQPKVDEAVQIFKIFGQI